MMKLCLRSLLIFLSLFSAAQAKPLLPTNSENSLEKQISARLEEKFKIKPFTKANETKPDDVKIITQFREDVKNNKPAVVAFIDTRVLNKSESGKAVSQLISITSIAKIKIDFQNRLKLLEWANSWNKKAYPVRIIITNDNIVTASYFVTTVNDPVDEDTVLSSYVTLIELWPAVIQSLEKNQLFLR